MRIGRAGVQPSRRPWRALALYGAIALFSFLPPLTAVPHAQEETPQVILAVILATSETVRVVAPIVHVATLLILYAVWRVGDRVGRIASGFFAGLFTLFALENFAVTEAYGPTLVTGNFAMILVVAILWWDEAARPRNRYRFPRRAAWRYWFLPLAVLAFWFPAGGNLQPDFNPVLLLTSDFGVFVCPTTPVILGLLSLMYPGVNRRLFSVTAYVALLLGIFNAASVFVMAGYTAWMLFLHVPLLSIATYGLLLPRLTEPNVALPRTPSAQQVG